MDLSGLLPLIVGHKWLALTAVLIGLVVRLLKDDTTIPISIPPRLRAPLALALGGFAGALDKFLAGGGTQWKEALTQGLLGSLLAIAGHAIFIGSIRGGKELPIPGLTKEGVPPGPGKPPSLPPPPSMPPVDVDTKDLSRSLFRRHGCFLLGIALACWLSACNLFSASNLPSTLLTLKDLACIAENAFVDSPELNAICDFIDPKIQAEAAKVQKVQRVAIAKKAKALACVPPDAGTEKDGGK